MSIITNTADVADREMARGIEQSLITRLGGTVTDHSPAFPAMHKRRLRDLMCICTPDVSPDQSVNNIVGRTFRDDYGYRASDGPGYMTTGNFPNLLLNALNKAALAPYQAFPQTWRAWVRTGPPASDFKELHRVRAGGMGNQPMVAENQEYKDLTILDSGETYRVAKYGSMVSLSYEAIVNDDLGQLSQMVRQQGASMARTINKVAYDLLVSNSQQGPVMSDGDELFKSGNEHGNYATDALDAPGLDAGFSAMMTQTGLSSVETLGIPPRYLIHPVSLSSEVDILLRSTGSLEANQNSGVINRWGPTGPRGGLVSVMEPALDATSTTGWYLTADPALQDTFEMTFLAGESEPTFSREQSFATDALKWKVRQSFGVGAIDWRGLYYSTGTA